MCLVMCLIMCLVMWLIRCPIICLESGDVSGDVSGHVSGQHDPQCKKTAMSVMQLWPQDFHNGDEAIQLRCRITRTMVVAVFTATEMMQPALQL
jgi:hypothetical protein